MIRPRVIPCLLLQDRGLVKTVRFKDPKYLGDPINIVRIFNDKEVDELVFLDIQATPENPSALGFVTASMGVGAAALVIVSALHGGGAALARFTPGEWLAAIYLGAGGGALAFFLWVYALQYASPSRVANTMTVNPIVAGLLAVLILHEPITFRLAVGLIAVCAGLWIATTDAARRVNEAA